MSKLPSFKTRGVLSILFKNGFEKVRTSGSHIRLKKGNDSVTVSYHPSKIIPKGTLKSIIRQSGIPQEKFK